MNSGESKKFNVDSLAARLSGFGIRLSAKAVQTLWRYHVALRDADAELNLTRIRNFEAVVRKHYVDSLIILNILEREGLELPPVLVDVGTGGGFPGVPLAIARPDCSIFLVEARGARADFLKRIVSDLPLPNAEAVALKVFSGQPGPKGSVITRALARMEDTISRTAPARVAGDWYLFLKGPNCDDEIEAVRARGDCELVRDAHYRLPDSTDRRRLVIWRYLGGEPAPGADGAGSLSVGGGGPGSIQLPPGAELISSTDNPLFRKARTLWKGRMIRKHGLALAHGRRLVSELIASEKSRIEAVFVSEREAEEGARLSADNPRLPVRFLAHALMSELDPHHVGGPVALLRVNEPAELTPAHDLAGVSVLLPLGDPENLGAALRSCLALGADRAILLAEAAHPFHPKAIRASAGACFGLELLVGPALRDLRDFAQPLFVLDGAGADYRSTDYPGSLGLLVGEEGGRIPSDIQATRISIPIRSGVESLNANVALSLALAQLRRT